MLPEFSTVFNKHLRSVIIKPRYICKQDSLSWSWRGIFIIDKSADIHEFIMNLLGIYFVAGMNRGGHLTITGN